MLGRIYNTGALAIACPAGLDASYTLNRTASIATSVSPAEKGPSRSTDSLCSPAASSPKKIRYVLTVGPPYRKRCCGFEPSADATATAASRPGLAQSRPRRAHIQLRDHLALHVDRERPLLRTRSQRTKTTSSAAALKPNFMKNRCSQSPSSASPGSTPNQCLRTAAETREFTRIQTASDNRHALPGHDGPVRVKKTQVSSARSTARPPVF